MDKQTQAVVSSLSDALLRLGQRRSLYAVLLTSAYFALGKMFEGISDDLVGKLRTKISSLFSSVVGRTFIGVDKAIRRRVGQEYGSISLSLPIDVNPFLHYVRYNAKFYQTPSHTLISETTGRTYPFALNEDIAFNDTLYNLKGFYRVVEINEGTETTRCTPKTIKIFGQTNTDQNMYDYFVFIVRWYSNDIAERKTIRLSEITVLAPEVNLSYVFYEGNKKPLEEQEAQFISSFFHPDLVALWSPIKQMVLNPGFAGPGIAMQVNYLFYGPPGTGKSGFAYRIAQTLGRDIIYFSLTSLTKGDIHQVMTRPFVGGISKTCRDVVYVFDEFDITVAALCDQQRGARKREEELLTLISEKIDREKEKSKEGESAKEYDIMLASVKSDLAAMHNKFQLHDLLGLLQGPVPRSGSIIIATTNHFEKIREMCPELLRPGRLTPVYFGNFGTKEVQDVCRFYFKQEIELPQANISLCPAEVMLKVVEAQSVPQKGCDYFKAKILELIAKQA